LTHSRQPTPFGKQIRKLRIDANIRLGDMAEALGKQPSFVSDVELGARPLSNEYVGAVIEYLKTLPYFRKHRLDVDYLQRLADRTRRTVDVEALPEDDRAAVAGFARRLPNLPAQKREAVKKKLEQWLGDQED
jgi:transcriptional regulator with XRE-family HTH domain